MTKLTCKVSTLCFLLFVIFFPRAVMYKSQLCVVLGGWVVRQCEYAGNYPTIHEIASLNGCFRLLVSAFDGLSVKQVGRVSRVWGELL